MINKTKLFSSVSCLLWLIATPFYFWLSHYVAVFPHEYGHSLIASLSGFKDHFWQIDYGGKSLANVLLLANIDEQVNYTAMYAAHKDWLVALTAFAGPGFGNGLTYLISLWGMSQRNIESRPWLFYFFFWWNINSIGNFIDYVPIRTFAPHGDMFNLQHGLHISPWWLMIILGYLIVWVCWYFYTHTLLKAYTVLKLQNYIAQTVLLVIATGILFFGFYGRAGLYGYGEISEFLSLLSAWIIPPIIVACLPWRKWVIDNRSKYEE